MIGFIWGAIGGAVQFLLLKKLALAITSGKEIDIKIVLCIIGQIFFPICVLLLCALIILEQLVYCGIGIAAVLLICAVITFILRMRKGTKND